MPEDMDMSDARWIIASVFKGLYLSGLREIRLRQTEFSIYLVEQLSSIPIRFENL